MRTDDAGKLFYIGLDGLVWWKPKLLSWEGRSEPKTSRMELGTDDNRDEI